MTVAYATGWYDTTLGAGGSPPDSVGLTVSGPLAPSAVPPGPSAGASGLHPGGARISVLNRKERHACARFLGAARALVRRPALVVARNDNGQ